MSGDASDSSVSSLVDKTPTKTSSSKDAKNDEPKKKRAIEDSGDNNKSAQLTKKIKRQKNISGDEMIPLGNNKFVTVREFRGKVLIDIREYYEKDDKMLPGKKGISLSREQYTDLKASLSEIDTLINEL